MPGVLHFSLQDTIMNSIRSRSHKIAKNWFTSPLVRADTP